MVVVRIKPYLLGLTPPGATIVHDVGGRDGLAHLVPEADAEDGVVDLARPHPHVARQPARRLLARRDGQAAAAPCQRGCVLKVATEPPGVLGAEPCREQLGLARAAELGTAAEVRLAQRGQRVARLEARILLEGPEALRRRWAPRLMLARLKKAAVRVVAERAARGE